MNSKINRFISCLLISCFIFQVPIIHAANKDDIMPIVSEMLSSIILDPYQTGFEDADFDNLYIGEKLPLYNEDFTEMTNKEMRFIYHNTELIALFTKNSIGEFSSYSINVDIANMIGDVIKDSDTFFLQYIDNRLTIVSEGQIVDVKDNRHIKSKEGNISMEKQSNVNKISLSENIRTLIDINIAPLAITSKYLNVEFISQGDGDCWAASAIAFGRYYNTTKTVSLTTATNYANTALPNGTGFEKAARINAYYFNVATRYDENHNNMKVTKIMQLIDANDLVLVAADNYNVTLGHMFIIRGYSQSSSGYTLSVRDSNFSNYTTIYGTSETFIYDLPEYGEPFYYTGYLVKN